METVTAKTEDRVLGDKIENLIAISFNTAVPKRFQTISNGKKLESKQQHIVICDNIFDKLGTDKR